MVELGHQYKMLGHWLEVIEVIETNTSGNRVILKCNCCKDPEIVNLEILERDLKNIALDKL